MLVSLFCVRKKITSRWEDSWLKL